MTDGILRENQSGRVELPIWLLLCYSLFTAWQMGVVFFSGEALSLHGKTPLPAASENVAAVMMTAVILSAYLLSALFLVFWQRRSILCAKLGVGASLVFALALYLPLPDALITGLIMAQTFCCVFLTGVCISVAVNLFTEKTELYDVLVTAVFADLLIAVLQNDIAPVPYDVFHAFTVIALSLILLFFFSLPGTRWPDYAEKDSPVVKPRRFFAGVYFLIGISCVLTLFGNAVGESVPHGITVFSVSTAVSGAAVFLLWKLKKISPLRCGKVLIALGAFGFLLAVAGFTYPALLYGSCFLLGCGNLACALTGFYGIVLMKRRPSRFITPAIVVLAALTVLLHAALLGIFRDRTAELYLLYSVLALIAAFAYLIIEPYLLWSMNQSEQLPNTSEPLPEPEQPSPRPDQAASEERELSTREVDSLLSGRAISPLSGQELRVAELILGGYTGAEIADMLNITENTVKGYRKNLYSKLDIHSIRELFMLAGSRRRET